MAIWLARYHGGLGFSLAVSLTFLAMIVHQRAPYKTSNPAEVNASLAEQVEPPAQPSQAPNAYAEKWRAMANEYYAKHPLPDDSSSQQVARDLPESSSHNEPSLSTAPSSSVQLASHQQSTSQHDGARRTISDQPAARESLPASPLQVFDAEILPTHSAIAAIADLGIGGLLAGLSAAGVAFIFFHTAWPVAGKSRVASGAHPTHQPSIRVSSAVGETTDERELRIELPSAWVQTPRSLSETLRIAVIATSYLAILGAILGISLA